MGKRQNGACDYALDYCYFLVRFCYRFPILFFFICFAPSFCFLRLWGSTCEIPDSFIALAQAISTLFNIGLLRENTHFS